jgi:hypothetical protein
MGKHITDEEFLKCFQSWTLKENVYTQKEGGRQLKSE